MSVFYMLFDYFHSCVSIHLIPKNFIYKTLFKRRIFKTPKHVRLVYGHAGLLLTAPVILTSKHLFRFTLLIKKAARRSDKTFRKFWLYIFPTTPLTRKSLGLRMGKGKGKRQTWIACVRPGVFLFEVRNLRPGRAMHFFHQLDSRISMPTKPRFAMRGQKKIYHFQTLTTTILPFW